MKAFLRTLQLVVAASALSAYATPVELAPRAGPTLYLAGDSTMAKSSDGTTDGGYFKLILLQSHPYVQLHTDASLYSSKACG